MNTFPQRCKCRSISVSVSCQRALVLIQRSSTGRFLGEVLNDFVTVDISHLPFLCCSKQASLFRFFHSRPLSAKSTVGSSSARCKDCLFGSSVHLEKPKSACSRWSPVMFSLSFKRSTYLSSVCSSIKALLSPKCKKIRFIKAKKAPEVI